ncbi:potassium channel family protein [Metabacillus malikii]|uniref:Voltage-gated potassium channel n=1 Tax=Metabacillus malikii TaxID=1504265 RepID=A0ABT9ZCG6_9BACI|nr:potassium channel family protein [Metabacillus malikii]MDQ0229947.1 voltage-gated potassium channel [Metabacillus malikii]
MNKTIVSFTYEILLACLIIFSVVVKLPNDQDYILSWFVWGLFLIDYVIRFIVSDDKKSFIKNHPLELIALIPLDQLFRTLRLVRLFRIVRLIALIYRKDSFLEVLTKKYKVDRIFIVIVILLFFSATLMFWLEPNFETFEDALWWSVVTTTTVGYGDLYPETTVGRLIASFLMFVGIGLIGVVTGTVASYFSRGRVLPEQLKYVKDRIDNSSSLTETEIDIMITKLEEYKQHKDSIS